MFFKSYVRLIGAIAVIFISLIDYFITIDLSFSILYLLPISFVSWYGERWLSIILVLISTSGKNRLEHRVFDKFNSNL